MSYVFCLQEWHRYGGWAETLKVSEVDGSVEELTDRLHGWAVEVVSKELARDGEYWAHFVDVSDNGNVRFGTTLDTTDVYWFGGEEYVPASSVPA
jgi:hypothetical protein